MDLGNCEIQWATGEHADPKAQAAAVRRLAWKPPAGHASWCTMQTPPWWRRNYDGMDSQPAIARAQCDCPKNSVGKALARLNGQPAPKVPQPVKPQGAGLVAALERILADVSAARLLAASIIA